MKRERTRDLFDVEACLQRFLLANSNAASADEYAGVRRWIYGNQIDDAVIAVIVDGTPMRLARDPYRFDMPIRFSSDTPGVDEWLLAGGRLLRTHQQGRVEVILDPASAAARADGSASGANPAAVRRPSADAA
jgi:hypothetical protein